MEPVELKKVLSEEQVQKAGVILNSISTHFDFVWKNKTANTLMPDIEENVIIGIDKLVDDLKAVLVVSDEEEEESEINPEDEEEVKSKEGEMPAEPIEESPDA